MKIALLSVVLFVLLPAAVFGVGSSPRRSGQDGPALFSIVEALIRLRPFTLEAVGRITGTIPKEFGSNEYFAMFESNRAGKGPIIGVELRLPKPASSKRDGLVILSIDPAACLLPETVEKRFGPGYDVDVPEPAAPYEFTYGYRQSWGSLSFQFARGTRCLVSVALDAVEWQPDTGKKWLDAFPAYPGARELCSQHVTGNVMHIVWSAYVTRDATEQVNGFYLREEGKEHAEQNENSLSFRHGDKVLSIHRASAKDYPDCGKAPSPEDKTVLIVSQAIRPK